PPGLPLLEGPGRPGCQLIDGGEVPAGGKEAFHRRARESCEEVHEDSLVSSGVLMRHRVQDRQVGRRRVGNRRGSLAGPPSAVRTEWSVRCCFRELHPSFAGGHSMLVRRLLAGLMVLGLAVGLSLPALGQEKKDKDKDKGKDSPTGGEAVTLKWKFDKDKIFYQKMTTETKQTMKVM